MRIFHKKSFQCDTTRYLSCAVQVPNRDLDTWILSYYRDCRRPSLVAAENCQNEWDNKIAGQVLNYLCYQHVPTVARYGFRWLLSIMRQIVLKRHLPYKLCSQSSSYSERYSTSPCRRNLQNVVLLPRFETLELFVPLLIKIIILQHDTLSWGAPLGSPRRVGQHPVAELLVWPNLLFTN